MEFYLEIARVVVITTVLILLVYNRRRLVIARLPGFRAMLAGFSLLVFGATIDVADDFLPLSHWHLFGEIDIGAIVKNIVGYLGGLALVVFGLTQLLPKAIGLGRLQKNGVVPICSSCKKVRIENGEWVNIDAYLHHTACVEFSHGYCPDCEQKSLQQDEDFSI